MKAEFLNFINRGELGSIRCGVSKRQIYAQFGEPESWSDKPGYFRTGLVANFLLAKQWFYHGFGLEFENLSEDAKTTKIRLSPKKSNPEWFEGFFPDHLTTFVQIKKFLYKNNIDFGVKGGLFGESYALTIGAHVTIGAIVDQTFLKERARSLSGSEYQIRAKLEDSISDLDKVVSFVEYRCSLNPTSREKL